MTTETRPDPAEVAARRIVESLSLPETHRAKRIEKFSAIIRAAYALLTARAQAADRLAEALEQIVNQPIGHTASDSAKDLAACIRIARAALESETK